ncbi:MAG: very short patch repair endonuclease [Planctomycetes bacterium]|nr:very short patch repair endonuclease [Planctomycetota bacterium]
MTDKVNAQRRSSIMKAVKSRGNASTELKLIEYFQESNIKGWSRSFPLIGNPDFVFAKFKVAVFVDGCFWHGCKKHCRMPKSNTTYWEKKIERNAAHDSTINKNLDGKGWKVIRLWEHELSKRPTQKLNRLKRLLAKI